MNDGPVGALSWVVLTMGQRAETLAIALGSISASGEVVLVVNGDEPVTDSFGARVVSPGRNLGVPGGRDLGLRSTPATLVVGFLDDDAELLGAASAITEAFDADARLGAVALRLVDESGDTARRHVPRLGGRNADRPGEVALFLGGACAIRREAYDEVGGYFCDLFYGHEEVELCWRLVDAGWTIRYLADVHVFHPRTAIERHADGWELTGRNRVLVARRTLPWIVAIAHAVTWLVVGGRRAPAGPARSHYLRGWRSGWRIRVDRNPIGWRGVARLVRLGRPPIV